jgi:hemerythrin-like domain-containing protein
MSDHLQNDMPTMLAEHEAIGKALERLRAAAREERKPGAARFAEHLKAHAKQEEEILYPAAILAGRYLKLKPR